MQKVAGPSAFTYFKLFVSSLILWLVGAFAIGLLVIVTRDPLSIPVVVAFIGTMILMALTLLFVRLIGTKREKENAAGYTSSPISMFDFPEMDPKSGRIIREANEPRLRGHERRARVSATRRSSSAEDS